MASGPPKPVQPPVLVISRMTFHGGVHTYVVLAAPADLRRGRGRRSARRALLATPRTSGEGRALFRTGGAGLSPLARPRGGEIHASSFTTPSNRGNSRRVEVQNVEVQGVQRAGDMMT